MVYLNPGHVQRTQYFSGSHAQRFAIVSASVCRVRVLFIQVARASEERNNSHEYRGSLLQMYLWTPSFFLTQDDYSDEADIVLNVLVPTKAALSLS
ncbi:hypothetical protein F2P81_013192 [Scophthalmus maximus]|uniref:Uncharacterized protein n=1 Tax=Scophthalmus maximus TaxID=52904 RepID=A0A6A4SWJ2_SCOMX|nr:hypothetical protein F2P81_013192 [Scophthalmus maximus]